MIRVQRQHQVGSVRVTLRRRLSRLGARRSRVELEVVVHRDGLDYATTFEQTLPADFPRDRFNRLMRYAVSTSLYAIRQAFFGRARDAWLARELLTGVPPRGESRT